MSDDATLLEIAESVGLDREGAAAALADEALSDTIRAEQAEALEMGITAVPMMLVNRKFMIPGAQEPETYAAYLRKVVERSANAD